MRSLKGLSAELKQSSTLMGILLLLQEGRESFSALQGKVKVSTRTLSKHLKYCRKHGLVQHQARNAPYEITAKGQELLEMLKTEPVEDFVIDYVKGGPFAGSIIFRVPKRFVQVFNGLYTPSPLEGLRRAFLVAFTFWVNRYGCNVTSESTGQRTGGTVAYGKDFNNDKIWDLTMYETPASGYPNIKRALKKGEFMLDGKIKGIFQGNVWIWALDALEEKLSEARF